MSTALASAASASAIARSSSSSSSAAVGRRAGRRSARARGESFAVRGSRRDELAEVQRRFSRACDEAGVRVERAREGDVKACVNLVCDAFAGTEDAKPRAYVLKYVVGLVVDDDCEETALVAKRRREGGTVSDGDDEGGDGDASASEEVVGFVTVSISAKTRPPERDRNMSPPPDAAYLANACVAKSARREGIGRALLQSVEELVLEMGGCDVWLHVRENEPAPLALYSGEGYERVAKEQFNVFEGIFGGKRASPRILMRKELRSDGSCNFML